jgi:hypothetical protein
MPQTLRQRAKVRKCRDDGRSTEDDLAKAKLGPQGVPGKSDKPSNADKLQMSKVTDPGHVA